MKDFTKEQLEASRPSVSVDECLNHCLTSLYADNKHHTTDFVSPNLPYEELIGALLMARDTIKEQANTISGLNEEE